jgi:hypothetical protein
MLRTIPLIAILMATPFAGRDYRNLPCKTAENAPMCFRVHARLAEGNGTPSTRLWPMGTHRLYGIYSNLYGFQHEGRPGPAEIASESPELPSAVEKLLPTQGGWTVYGDFEVCPLERHIEGHMQAACVSAASHIVATKD